VTPTRVRRVEAAPVLEIPAIAKDLNYSESGGVRTGFSIGAQSDDNKQLGADQVITFNAGKIERFFANRLGVEFKFRSYTADAWGQLAGGWVLSSLPQAGADPVNASQLLEKKSGLVAFLG